MRDIKFRAWDEKRKLFWYSDDEAYFLKEYNGELWLVEDGGFYREGCKEYTKISSILMQYAGLKDKNGKKIYEGDVVKYDDSDGWDVGKDEVKFISGAFNCCCFHPGNQQFIDENRVIEIIGNIHENPELLESLSNV